MNALFVLVATFALVTGACSSSDDARVVIAAGTTVVDSGFVEALVDAYRNDGGDGKISVVGLSSQQSLAYATAGNADVTITHDPASLEAFLESTPQAVSHPAFTSRFIYVAAPDLRFPDRSVDAVLRQVASRETVFVSRDDGSGTHTKEVALWERSGVETFEEPWYIRTGAGMGDTLQVTDQREGVTLSELGAYLAATDQLSLEVVDTGSDPSLDNPYAVTVVAPEEDEAAARFGAWLTSEAGRTAIVEVNDALFGVQVYRLP